MKIYIASSWKNQHAVEMLTEKLRQMGHEVISFIEYEKQMKPDEDFDKWMWGERGEATFRHDVNAAMNSNLVIYVSPSGTDAWAEVGAAYGSGVTIFGLAAKGEPSGLMRRMMSKWFFNYRTLLGALEMKTNTGGEG